MLRVSYRLGLATPTGDVEAGVGTPLFADSFKDNVEHLLAQKSVAEIILRAVVTVVQDYA